MHTQFIKNNAVNYCWQEMPDRMCMMVRDLGRITLSVLSCRSRIYRSSLPSARPVIPLYFIPLYFIKYSGITACERGKGGGPDISQSEARIQVEPITKHTYYEMRERTSKNLSFYKENYWICLLLLFHQVARQAIYFSQMQYISLAQSVAVIFFADILAQFPSFESFQSLHTK